MKDPPTWDVGLGLTGLYLTIEDFDSQYEQNAENVLLVNNFDTRNEEDVATLNSLMITEFTSDVLDTKPSCVCEKTHGEPKRGWICEHCGTEVVAVTERPMESILWARVPEGVTSFFSPQAWAVLANSFKYRGVDMMRYMADPSYQIKNKAVEQDSVILKLKEMKWKRSMNYFIDNFDKAVDYLLQSKIVKPAANRRMVELFIVENKHKFFPKYIPVPNKNLFISEVTSLGTWVDKVIFPAIDGVRDTASLEHGALKTTQQVRENRVIKVVIQLSEFYHDYRRENMSGKPGLYRRQLFGLRMDYTTRCVISSIHGVHDYDELHIPWGVGLILLKIHILNKLCRRGYSPNEADQLIMLHVKRYHPLLDEIMTELLNEGPKGGPRIMFQRNPSLLRGSAQLLRITRIKGCGNRGWEIELDSTISLSVLVLKAYGADFDGDEMNGKLALDQHEMNMLSRLEPHLSVMSTNAPFTVSGVVEIPGPILATLANFVHEDDAVLLKELKSLRERESK